MAYTKTTWTDSDNKYDIKTQADVVLYNDVKLVWDGTTGTPLSATNLNKIENELEALDANYGTCSTAAATAAKVVTLSGFTLSVKTIFGVTFANVNTASAVTLAVNSAAAMAVYVGASAATATQIPKVAYFQYDGTYFQLLNPASVTPLYEKIRDIADTSGTTSVSIDLSDIDWSVWQKIKLICSVGVSSSANVNLRVNSINDAYYKYSYNISGATMLSGGTAQTELYHSENSIGTLTNNPMRFSISISKYLANGNAAYHFTFDEIIDNGVTKTGSAAADYRVGTSLSTFNIVSATAGLTVSLADASLSGVRK